MTERAPGPYEAHVAQARTALRTGRVADAERCGRKALACDPDRGDAYNVLAIVRLLRHDILRARALVLAGLAVEPHSHALQTNLQRLGRIGTGPPLLGDEVCEAPPYR